MRGALVADRLAQTLLVASPAGPGAALAVGYAGSLAQATRLLPLVAGSQGRPAPALLGRPHPRGPRPSCPPDHPPAVAPSSDATS
eukprot:scaffold2799_cov408-Prasinococcus_capsulatus_cf.AAC.4